MTLTFKKNTLVKFRIFCFVQILHMWRVSKCRVHYSHYTLLKYSECSHFHNYIFYVCMEGVIQVLYWFYYLTWQVYQSTDWIELFMSIFKSELRNVLNGGPLDIEKLFSRKMCKRLGREDCTSFSTPLLRNKDFVPGMSHSIFDGTKMD